MFSQEAVFHAAGCSICWMCRHLCPIGNVTGKEIHFPRGKAILVSLTVRGNDVLKESAQAMYDCLLCNHCANWCETGYEPAKFIREARRELAAINALPPAVQGAVDKALNSEGCLYGSKAFSGELKDLVDSLPEKAPVLLVLGDAIALRQPEIGVAAIRLLERAGVDFTVLKQEPSPANDLYDLIGELSDVEACAIKFTNAVHDTRCETVIALDPYTARILVEDYPRWNCELPPVRTATAYLSELLNQGRIHVQRALDIPVTYHDPERLSRDLKETQPARMLIEAMAGSFQEIFLHGENTRSCGNDVVGAYSPDIIQKTGRLRMDDILRTGAKLLITASPSDKGILSRVNEPHVTVEDLFVLLDKCCSEEVSI